MRGIVLILMVGISAMVAWAGAGGSVVPVQLPGLPLGLVTLQKSRAVNLAVSPAAGAFRLADDPPGRIWTVTDRGPIIDCSEEREVTGAEDKSICAPERRGKIYLLPGYVPSIYAIDVMPDNTARYIDMVPLKGRSGKLLTGVANPLGPQRAEASYMADGRGLEPDPSGVEPGGLVRLSDGTFWIADKFGPSLLQVAADGTVLRRLVPEGLEQALKGADYPVVPLLPRIAGLRSISGGFDSLAISSDERFLYVALQNALVNPGVDAYRSSPAVRLWKIERESARVVGAFVYRLDPVGNFPADSGIAGRALRQSDVRIAEMAVIGEDRLLVLERVRNGARLFAVTLEESRALPAIYDDDRMRPSLEELFPDVWEIAGISALDKQLIIDSEKAKGLGGRLSAMARLSPQELIVMSNAVYGVEGGRSQMFRLTFSQPVLQ